MFKYRNETFTADVIIGFAAEFKYKNLFYETKTRLRLHSTKIEWRNGRQFIFEFIQVDRAKWKAGKLIQ